MTGVNDPAIAEQLFDEALACYGALFERWRKLPHAEAALRERLCVVADKAFMRSVRRANLLEELGGL